MLKHIHLYVFLLLATCLSAQSTQLTLSEVVEMAKSQSIAYKQAETLKETQYWEWRSYQSNYKPQLILSGKLPDFSRTFQQVIQQSGSIEFQPINQNNSFLNFSLSQSIAKTGTTLFVNSQLQRFDDFNQETHLYNSIPIGVGISQPLFAFNQLKWDRQTEPLRYEESKQFFVESLEHISIDANTLYFEFLISQVNLQIAETNLNNNDTIYKIAQERHALGKISRNDLLQLQLEVLKSKKSVASAAQNLEVAALQLRSFISYREIEKIELILPSSIPNFQIDTDKALQEAFSNRSDAIAFNRRRIEAEREVDRAEKENGFNATLFATFGLTNSATQLDDLYKDPQDRETINVGFDIPIMDWGRSKSRRETAKANQKLVNFELEQDQIDFEQEIYTLVTLIRLLKDQLELSQSADSIAEERYEIAKNRFLIGNLSITDLTLALQEKDQAKRDYIFSLRDFWDTWFKIRAKTLYDFETQNPIQ